jgi:hypothetical protein
LKTAAQPYIEPREVDVAADPVVQYMNREALGSQKNQSSMESGLN